MDPVSGLLAVVTTASAIVGALSSFVDWLAGLFGSSAREEREAKRRVRDAGRRTLRESSLVWPSHLAPPSWSGRDTSRTIAVQSAETNTVIDPSQRGTWIFPRYTEGQKELTEDGGVMIFAPDSSWGIEEMPYRMPRTAR